MDELVLPARHVERRTIEALALPFRREADDNDGDIGCRSELDGVLDCLIWIDLLATTQSLEEISELLSQK